jgi:phosphatidylglycerophosphate synthase
VATPIARLGISPNTLSLCALPLASMAALALHTQHYRVGFWWGLAAALVDLLDGTVADLQGKRSPFGNYFETMIDRIVEVLLLLGVCSRWPLLSAWAACASLLVSYAKARVGLVIVTDNHDWPAVGERPERLAIFLTACFFGDSSTWALPLGLALLGAAGSWGTVARMRYAKRLIEQAQTDGGLLPYLKDTGAVPSSGSLAPRLPR